MIKHTAALLVFAGLACALLAGCGKEEQATSSFNAAEKGAEFVNLLAEGKFDIAATWLDPTMAAAMSAAKLQEAWGTLSSKGAYQGIAGTRTATEQGFAVAYVTCNFEQGAMDVKVVFDQQGRVSGLWFVPPP